MADVSVQLSYSCDTYMKGHIQTKHFCFSINSLHLVLEMKNETGSVNIGIAVTEERKTHSLYSHTEE